MDERYKESFEKIKMDSARKDEIRGMIIEGSNIKKKRTGTIGLLVAAAAIIAIMTVPPSRNMVFAAARYLKNKFTMSNGINVEITSEEGNNGKINSVLVTSDSNDHSCIAKEDGRILFTLDDKNEDITDKITPDNFYKYEKKIEDGYTSIVYVGGGSENANWIEMVFDKDGKYISFATDLSEDKINEISWVKKAKDDAGVKGETPVTFMFFGFEEGTSETSE